MNSILNPAQRRAVLQFSSAIRDDGRLRAALRRASVSDDVIGLEAVVRLQRAWDEPDQASVEALAILLSHRSVKSVGHDEAAAKEIELPAGESLAERFGRSEGPSTLLSPLRFQRLIHARTLEDRLRHLRRALGLLATQSLHPLHLASAWLQLNRDHGRRRFARDYFAPTPNIPTTESHEVTP
jgi:CRISPR type I-E-associated protein CasB/Cse2